jgi:hypothetical protein
MAWSKKFFPLITVFAIIFIAVIFLYVQNYATQGKISQLPGFSREISQVLIGGNAINIEIVETGEDRSRGLSGREGLEPDSGMLFVFESPGRHGIWMRDMNFPIDILWIGRESERGSQKYVVIDIKHNVYDVYVNSTPHARLRGA